MPYYIPVGYIIYKITRAVSGEKIRFRGHDLHAQAHIAAEASRRLTEGACQSRGISLRSKVVEVHAGHSGASERVPCDCPHSSIAAEAPRRLTEGLVSREVSVCDQSPDGCMIIHVTCTW